MKIALYIEPNTTADNSFYTKVSLIKSFEEKGHTLDVFIPLDEYKKSKLAQQKKELNDTDKKTELNKSEKSKAIDNENEKNKKKKKKTKVKKTKSNVVKTESNEIEVKREDDGEQNNTVNVENEPIQTKEQEISETNQDKVNENNSHNSILNHITQCVDKKDFPFIGNDDDFNNISKNIKTTFPSPNDYDVLLVTDTHTKKWHFRKNNYIFDSRVSLMNTFIENNKQVLCIKDTPLIEYRFTGVSNVKNGICTDKIYDMKYFDYKPSKTFIMPFVSNLSYEKLNSLSKEEFYKKYNLDTNKKLLAIFPGKISKWHKHQENGNRNYYKVKENVKYFMDNIEEFYKIAEENNYVFVSKLHVRDKYEKWHKNRNTFLNFKKITYIEPQHTHELLKYADKAISYATTMVYQLYLYNLPSFDIGTGIYYFGWSESKKKGIQSPLEQYNNGIDLIYGEVATNFLKEGKTQFEDFIKKKYKISKFKYQKDNPIYGDSYGTTINDVRDSILKQIK